MKLSDLSDEQWFLRLSARRDRQLAGIRYWWSYYDNCQPMHHVAKVLDEQNNSIPALTFSWGGKFIDSIDRATIVEGFILGGAEEADERLWEIFERNDLGEFQSENNITSLVTGESYMMLGPSDEGARITVESPDAVAVEVDPLSRRTIASLLFYKSDSEATVDDRAVLQVPDARTGGSRLIEFENGKIVGKNTQQPWMAGAAKLQSSPTVPVVRFPNRQRRGYGRSELEAIRPVVDAANLAATQMMATAKYHAMPRMLALNVAESMFMNQDGTVNQDAVKSAAGSMWVVPFDEERPAGSPEVDIKQLPASDLRNFVEMISLLGRTAAGLCDLPPHEFGFGVADNPTSADAVEALGKRFGSRVERIQRERGAAYGRVMRIAMAIEGIDPSSANRLQTDFRDPLTPTKSSMSAAAVGTLASGIADLHQARVDYGYTPTTIAAMEAREETAAADPYLERLNAKDVAANVAAGTPASGN